MESTYIFRLELSQNLGMLCDTTPTQKFPHLKSSVLLEGGSEGTVSAVKFKLENI